jgi:hypothetical protein
MLTLISAAVGASHIERTEIFVLGYFWILKDVQDIIIIIIIIIITTPGL